MRTDEKKSEKRGLEPATDKINLVTPDDVERSGEREASRSVPCVIRRNGCGDELSSIRWSLLKQHKSVLDARALSSSRKVCNTQKVD